MFGTEKVICPKNSEGWMVGVWDGLNLDRSKLSLELFGLIQTFFYLYPNSIQTGGVVQFCPNNTSNNERIKVILPALRLRINTMICREKQREIKQS